MDQVQLEHALAVHARAEKVKADEAQHTAAALRSDAKHAASQWPGAGAVEQAHRQRILEQAELKANEHEQVAQRHLERSAVAASGYLLHRNEVEVRDPHYSMENQSLIGAAYKHGVVLDRLPAKS